MEFKIHPHANKQHTERTLIDDIIRMLDADDYTKATCSFPKREWRDILVNEVIKLEKATFELWNADKYAQRRIAISHKFSDEDARRLQIPTTYVGVYADEFGHLYFGTTRTITIVLDKTREGILLYNAFPNMSPKNRTPIKNTSILPYAQTTSTWKKAHLAKRVYYRIRCDHLINCPVIWDEATSRIRINIQENDTVLGSVTLGASGQSWEITGDTAVIINDGKTHAKLLSRAYPQTYHYAAEIEKIKQIELAEQDLLSSSSGHAELPDLRDHYCQIPEPLDEQDIKTTSKPAKTISASTKRSKKRAMKRSQAASKSSNKKNKKARRAAEKKKTAKKKQQKTNNQPFQFKRVMTKFEEFGLEQSDQNQTYLNAALKHYAFLVNDAESECLIPGPVFEHVCELESPNIIAYVKLDKDGAQTIANDIDNKIDEANTSGSKEIYPDAAADETLKPFIIEDAVWMRSLNDNAITALLYGIAQDSHWHIILPTHKSNLLEKDAVDTMDRPVTRVCDKNAKHIVAEQTFGDNFHVHCELDYEEKAKQKHIHKQLEHIIPPNYVSSDEKKTIMENYPKHRFSIPLTNTTNLITHTMNPIIPTAETFGRLNRQPQKDE